jgi:kynureninase
MIARFPPSGPPHRPNDLGRAERRCTPPAPRDLSVGRTPSAARVDVARLDETDPLADFRERFVIPEEDLVYLDGNSLGRLSFRAAGAVMETLTRQWGVGLVRSWHDWLGLPAEVGNGLAPLIGARPGEVILGDQTSVNLYKLAWAALARSDRRVVASDDSNFPSDRYVLDAVAKALGGSYRELSVDPVEGPTVDDYAAALDDGVGLISLSHVAFRSGAIADMRAITDLAHAHGALVLWDLSHSAGAIPVELNATGVDLAVGCTYKHLNGGPGSPAFLYVREDLQRELEQPIPGWFGHDDMFAFEDAYRPAPDIRRFTIGTPPIPSLRLAQAGIALVAEAGIDAIRAKSALLTELILHGHALRLEPLGFELASPRDPARRGGHVALRHPDGYRITQALLARGVVPDFRAPDVVRLGVAPLYNRFEEVWRGIETLEHVISSGEQERFEGPTKGGVT